MLTNFQAFCSYFFCFSANWLERWGIVFVKRDPKGAREASVGAEAAKGVPVKTDGGLVPDLRRDWGWRSGGKAPEAEGWCREYGTGRDTTDRKGAFAGSPSAMANRREAGSAFLRHLSVPASPFLRLPPIFYLSFPYPFPII
ncbi:hypothetical protein [Sphingobacterium sp. CZ-UAM]|uniref:hypothetical protein n=1 Tax=Sphingobacterium sp. CZ-UAM TaxID=1933868 RepID=UPI0011154BEA|nr:hypothetical protein [Sphingobacterium sp. CZ-UAM]